MRPTETCGLIFLLVITSGCSLHPPVNPPLTPVHVVVDRVKDELNYLKANMPDLDLAAPPLSVCKNLDNRVNVKLTPTVAKLTLKTVATNDNAPVAGLVNPIGVLSINPSFTGDYSKSQSQSVELDLGFPPDSFTKPAPGAADGEDHTLAKTVIAAAKELLAVDHTKSPCVIPQSLNVLTTFDVVNKNSGGVTINLWVFQIGDKYTRTDEAHQNLEIDFDLSGSSPMGADGKTKTRSSTR